MATKKGKSFFSQHKVGLIISGIITFCWVVTSNVYQTFRASFEASMAANQLNDSVVQYSLIQKLIYGDLGPNAINAFFMVLIILLLIPTMVDICKKIKN